MKYVLRFSPEVGDDALAGYSWYEEKALGLGEEFLRTFYSTIAEILRHPFLSPELESGFRRRLIRKFPYIIYYTVKDNEIEVSGLFHYARDPAVINQGLNDRSGR